MLADALSRQADIQASQDEFGRSTLVDHFFVKGCLRFLVPILMEVKALERAREWLHACARALHSHVRLLDAVQAR